MSAPSPMCRTAILIWTLAAGVAAFTSRPVFADATGAASAAPLSSAKSHRKGVDARAAHDPRRTVHAHHPTAPVERRAKAERPTRQAERALRRRTFARASRPTQRARMAEEQARTARAREAHGASRLRLERERIEREAAAEAREPARTGQPAPPAIQEHGASAAVATSLAVAGPIIGAAPSLKSADVSPLARAGAFSLHGAMPPPLRGSLAVLERQDERLEADGLERIEDEDDLSARIEHHLLVPLPESEALAVNPELPAHHRYCRPWTARFLADLARAHAAQFHRPLEVSSAVRTVAYQARLMRINGNAAPAEGDIVSPHLMGATIDIAKKGMSRDEIAWMRLRLLNLELAGKIDVEEEFEQACFHITVYKSYAPARSPAVKSGGTRAPQDPQPTEAAGIGD